MSHWLIKVSFILLACSLVLAFLWLLHAADYEPAITFLAVLSAIIGFFVERWLSEREARVRTLKSIATEISQNLSKIKHISATAMTNNQKPNAFTRLHDTAIKNAIANRSLTSKKYIELNLKLYKSIDKIRSYNFKLDISEYTMTTGCGLPTIISHNEGIANGAAAKDTFAVLAETSKFIIENYGKEIGFTESTPIIEAYAD
jgi:hypothetical protein